MLLSQLLQFDSSTPLLNVWALTQIRCNAVVFFVDGSVAVDVFSLLATILIYSSLVII